MGRGSEIVKTCEILNELDDLWLESHNIKHEQFLLLYIVAGLLGSQCDRYEHVLVSSCICMLLVKGLHSLHQSFLFVVVVVAEAAVNWQQCHSATSYDIHDHLQKHSSYIHVFEQSMVVW